MNIADLPTIQALQTERAAAYKLLQYMAEGHVECEVVANGEHLDVFKHVSKETIQQAIKDGCGELILNLNDKLKALGVGTPPHQHMRPLASDTRDLAMYAGAWLRELGGKLFPKSHRIDALVVTTQRLVGLFEARGRQLTRLRQAIAGLDQTLVQGTPAWDVLVGECEGTDKLMLESPDRYTSQ